MVTGNEKTEIPEVIFDKPDLEKARVNFYSNINTIIDDYKKCVGIIEQLQASLAYAARQLSIGLEQNKDKHPEEILKELLDYRE